MIDELLLKPEILKALMSLGASVVLAMFTIYLLVKLVEKVIMQRSFTKRADDYLKQISENIDKLSNEDKEEE